MSGTTPNYAWPYQTLGDSPNGATLGQNGFVAADSTVKAIDTRLVAAEAELDTLDAVRIRCGCRLRRAANQSINSGATTLISWDTEDQDTNGFIAVTATTITIPAGKGGIYALTARVDYQLGLSAATRAFITANIASADTGVPATFRESIFAAEDFGKVSITLPLLAASTVTIDTFHNEGSAKNVLAWLSLYRIGV